MISNRSFSLLFSIILVLSVIFSNIPKANSLSQDVYKEYNTSSGKSSYIFSIATDDQVSDKSNWTITTSLIVDHMDKYKTFLFFSSILIDIETSNGKKLNKNIQFGHYPIGEYPTRLYQGGKWGPNNITINISKESLDIPSGGYVDAKIYVTVNLAEFIAQPFVVEQKPVTTYESFSIEVGSVRLTNEGFPIATLVPYVIGLAVGISILIGLIMRDRFSKRINANDSSNAINSLSM